MSHDVEVLEVAPTVFAAVRQRVARSELPRRVPQLLGEVWDFLKAARLDKTGHNVAVYRDPQADDIEVECGVQVSGTFADTERVRRSETPSGEAAHVVHMGPYGELRQAYDAMKKACRERGYREEAVHWEVYGDWSDDPSQLRTDVYGRVTRSPDGQP